MYKALIILLLAVTYASPSFAQTDTLKHEIGFSTQVLLENLFSVSEAPVELMYKNHLGRSRWLRLGLRANLNLTDSNREQDSNTQLYENNGYFIQPSLGLEKRTQLNNKWMIPFGFEALVSYSQYNRTQKSDSTSNNEKYISKDSNSSYGIAFRPFVGITYSPIPRLYFSTEASASVGYTSSHTLSEQFTNGTVQNTLEEDHSNVRFNLRPATAIFVYYRF